MKLTLTLSTLALIAALQAAPAQALTTDQLNQVAAVEAQIRDAVAQGQDTSGLVAELRSLHDQFGEDFGAFAGDDNPSDRDIVENALGRDDESGNDDGLEDGGEAGDDNGGDDDGGEGGDDNGGESGDDNSGSGGGESGDDNGGSDSGEGGDDSGGSDGGEGGNSGSGGGDGGDGGEGGDD